MYDVFISYCRAERHLVEPILARLYEMNLELFLDLDGIDGGAGFPDVIDKALRQSKAVLCFWSPTYFTRNWCLIECRFGVTRGVVTPVAIQPFEPDTPPADLAHVNYFNLTTWDGDDQHEDWNRMLRSLGGKVGRSLAPEAAKGILGNLASGFTKTPAQRTFGDAILRANTLPKDAREEIAKTVETAKADPVLGMLRSRRTLETVIRAVYAPLPDRAALSTRPIENQLEILRKREIIPPSIFLASNQVAKLSGFGMSCRSSEAQSEQVVQSINLLIDVMKWYFKNQPDEARACEQIGCGEPHAVMLHSSGDENFAQQLARSLSNQPGEILVKTIRIDGEDVSPQLEASLKNARTCLLTLGISGDVPWRNEALNQLLEQLGETTGLDLVPVVLKGGVRPEKGQVPQALRQVGWLNANTTADPAVFQRAVSERIFDHHAASGHWRVVDPNIEPYRGLQCFDVDNAATYFGREARLEWVLERLRPKRHERNPNRFLGIVGASGSGKSSFARAGIAAALKSGGLDGSENWPIAVTAPGRDPLLNLALALERTAALNQDIGDVIDRLRTDKRRLHLISAMAMNGRPESERLVLIIDQFEEVFTECQSEEDRQAFIENLCHAASVPDGRTWVILTMRDDFFGRCASYHDLEAALAGHSELVPAMSEAELRRAIEQPARMAGGQVEAALSDTLLDEMREQPGALPLLQHLLEQLWRSRENDELTLALYEQIGRLDGALKRHADTVYRSLDPDEQEFCRRVFSRLTRPGAPAKAGSTLEIDDTKRRVPLRELMMGQTPESAEDVIRRLADERLVVIMGGEIGDTNADVMVEIAHEALIRSWPTLRQWLEEDRESHRMQYELSLSVSQWREHGCMVGYLLHFDKLAQMVAWADENADQLNQDEQAYIDASVANFVRERSRVDLHRFTDAFIAIEPFAGRAEPALDAILSEAKEDSSEILFAALARLKLTGQTHAILKQRLMCGDLDEIGLILTALDGRQSGFADAFWQIVNDRSEDRDRRFCAALSLTRMSNFAADKDKWLTIAPFVADKLVDEVTYNPADYSKLLAYFKSARDVLLDSLLSLCSQERGKGMDRDATRFTWLTQLIADLAEDAPDRLCDFALDSDRGQFPLLIQYLTRHRDVLPEVLALTPNAVFLPGAEQDDKARTASRAAAAVLIKLHFGLEDNVWRAFESSTDPSLRTLVIHRFAEFRLRPSILLNRWRIESDPSIKSGLLQALGEFDKSVLDDAALGEFVTELLQIYEHDRRAGLHAAIEWLLRRWGYDAQIRAAQQRASNAPQRMPMVGDWRIDLAGHTMIALRAGSFLMGAGVEDPDGQASERQHTRHINRKFEISAHSVTRHHIQRFQDDVGQIDALSTDYVRAIVRSDDSAMTFLTWYDAARYCNWLSRLHGLPEEHWCYAPNADGLYAEGMIVKNDYLSLSGYRLPTEAEWEYASRAGAATRRFFGDSEDYLAKYAWYVNNTSGSPMPVGLLKPNEFGLFDALGNAWNWCADRFGDYVDNAQDLGAPGPVLDDTARVLRGGGFVNVSGQVRSACRNNLNKPSARLLPFGMRLVRTLDG